MANSLKCEEIDQIRALYLSLGSIKAVCRQLSHSRNTVRRLIRLEGISLPKDRTSKVGRDHKPTFKAFDLVFLEILFESSREAGDSLSFEKHIRTMAAHLAAELEIRTVVDQIRLEAAIAQFIVYRRFYLRSVAASDKRYEGPFNRSHEKLAKAVNSWVDASNKALEQFNRLIRELEVKNGKRGPLIKQGVFVQQNNSISVQSTPSEYQVTSEYPESVPLNRKSVQNL